MENLSIFIFGFSMIEKRDYYLIAVLFIVFINCSLQARKKALITGITGQDGRYLAEFLLDKGYEVHGVSRNKLACKYFENLPVKPVIHDFEKTTKRSFVELLKKIKPHEIYNLAAQSHVGKSFECPAETYLINSINVMNLLDAVIESGLKDHAKIFQAASCELFGKNSFANIEDLNFQPSSPYAISKLAAYWITRNYRETYNIFACNGILFNHESPYRAENFVSKKIARAVARIKYNQQDILYLGNLDIQKDWGYAKDYVECMWCILQQNDPDDYIIATGVLHSVREFVETAFEAVGISIEWRNTKAQEVGINKLTGKVVIKINPDFYRPIENNPIKATIQRTCSRLKWRPKTTFKELVNIMVSAECKAYGKIIIEDDI